MWSKKGTKFLMMRYEFVLIVALGFKCALLKLISKGNDQCSIKLGPERPSDLRITRFTVRQKRIIYVWQGHEIGPCLLENCVSKVI